MIPYLVFLNSYQIRNEERFRNELMEELKEEGILDEIEKLKFKDDEEEEENEK